MSNYLVTDTDMTSVADAIRTKGGTSASIAFPTGFVNAINDIPSGGGGGVEVDTCTIDISTMHNSIIWATRIVDNTIVTSIVEPSYSDSYTIQDVVCGSYMYVQTSYYILTGFSSTNGSSHVFEDYTHAKHMIQVTSASTDTISLWDDD